MKKALLPVLVLALAIGIAATMIYFKPKPESRDAEIVPTPVEVIVAKSGPTALTIQAQGTVSPDRKATLAAEVGGLVIAVSDVFETGKFVKKGDVLLSIDPTDYEAAVAESKANLRSAQTTLVQAQADAEQAIRDLAEVGINDPSPLARREPQLEQARLRVDSAQAALALAEKNLARTQIRAPFDGQVVETLVDLGDMLANRGSAIGTLYGTEMGELKLPLSRSEVLHLSLPDDPTEIAAADSTKPTATLTLGSGPNVHQATGWVDRLAGTTDPVTRLRNAIVLFRDPLDLKNSGNSSIPFGSFVSAEIEGKEIPAAFRLPVVALTGENTIRIVDEEDRLRERQVTIEQRTPSEIIVTEGLSDGERVCLTPLHIFAPGMLVRPVPNAPSPENSSTNGAQADTTESGL